LPVSKEAAPIERITPRVLREQSRVRADDRLQRCTTTSDRCGRVAFDDLERTRQEGCLLGAISERHDDAAAGEEVVGTQIAVELSPWNDRQRSVVDAGDAALAVDRRGGSAS